MTHPPRPERRRDAPRARLAALMAGAVLVSAAAGCASSNPDSSGLFSPYRIDLPQGNYVTREMLDLVRTGSTREQVRSALGSPLLAPLFRDDRWVYVFRYQHASGKADLRRVVVVFKDDRVSAIESDELPAREDPSDPALPGVRSSLRAGGR
jgi:outer membrane protein assembly factor BamE